MISIGCFFIFLIIPLCLFSLKLELAPPFGDHMVLQRDQVLPVWGRTEPNSMVTVQLVDVVKETFADEAGNWYVTMLVLSSNDSASKYDRRIWP